MREIGAPMDDDAAFIRLNGGSEIKLEDGATNFSSIGNEWTPTNEILLGNMATIHLRAEDRFRIQGVTLELTAVPEPTSLLMLGSVMLAGICYRKR